MNYVAPTIVTYSPTQITSIHWLSIVVACWIGYFLLVKIMYTSLWIWHHHLKPNASKRPLGRSKAK
jgi:hypothetical protein